MAAGPFALGHLGGLTQIVSFDLVDEVLAETRSTQARVRDLVPIVNRILALTWAFPVFRPLVRIRWVRPFRTDFQRN